MTFNMQIVRRVAPGVVVAAALMVGGCKAIQNITGGSSDSTSEVTGPSQTASKACVLRVTMATLMQEHVVLVAAATNADLAGRTDEYNSAKNALDQNSIHFANAISNVYGQQGADAFLTLWRTHNGYLMDYADGIASKNQDKQDAALKNLVGFTEDAGAFFDQSSGGKLSKDDVAEMIKENIYGLKGVIEAQAAKDFTTAYTREMVCEQDAQNFASTLSEAFVAQFTGKY